MDADEAVERRLASIMSADVVGYSRLMGADEAGTLARLKAYRHDLIDPRIDRHRGRIVKTSGDGLLIEFPSVIDAVQCAIEVQQPLSERNAALSETEQMHFRIGINLGDVIVEPDDIYGDGINVAARLQTISEPGGVCISSPVFDQVKNKMSLDYVDLGDQELKNIAEPVRAYRLRVGAGAQPEPPAKAAQADRQVGATAELPDKPSIAVLPFDNMSGDPEQEYFSDGITEDIITDLSKVSGLFVIARNSTFAYKGKSMNVTQVVRELGVRYVLEGSVRKAGDRVRVTAQLIDGVTGGRRWAERYDRKVEDIFSVQDELTEQIVQALEVSLTDSERERLTHKDTENLEAYDFLLRGKDLYLRFTREANDQARQMFEQAVALDPNFVPAYAELARVYIQARNHGWSESLVESLKRAREYGEKALALDDQLAQAHNVLGFTDMWQKRHEQARAHVDRALAVDPNFADSHMVRAFTLGFVGRAEEAVRAVEHAMRLNPSAPFWYMWALGITCFVKQDYVNAVAACKKASSANPNFVFAHLWLAAGYGLLGQPEAKDEAAHCLRLNPDVSVKWAMEVVPYEDPATLRRFADGLRAAGLPD